jgi:hypothetical protein
MRPHPRRSPNSPCDHPVEKAKRSRRSIRRQSGRDDPRSPTHGVPLRRDREDTGSRTPFNARRGLKRLPRVLFREVLHKHHADPGKYRYSLFFSMDYGRLKSIIFSQIRPKKRLRTQYATLLGRPSSAFTADCSLKPVRRRPLATWVNPITIRDRLACPKIDLLPLRWRKIRRYDGPLMRKNANSGSTPAKIRFSPRRFSHPAAIRTMAKANLVE